MSAFLARFNRDDVTNPPPPRPHPRRVADQQLLTASLDLVAADQVIALFYANLFHEHPEVRGMFPVAMDEQHDKLLKALVAVAAHYHNPGQVTPALVAMGRRHAEYGVTITHYAAVATILLGALAEVGGDAWTPEFTGAWQRAYTFAAATMLLAGVA